jgi:hypothetical protein
LISGGLALACATAHVAPPPPPAEPAAPVVSAPPPPPPVEKFDAKGFASSKVSPAECAQGAASLRQQSPDVGWAALRACIEKGTFQRGNFTSLRMVLAGTWNDDLAERADAPKLAARLIALRGGDIDSDLEELHKVRLPVFSLATAVSEPDMYKGRLLIVRGKPGQMAMEKGKPTMRLAETSEHAVQVWHQNRYRNSAAAEGAASGSYARNGRSDKVNAQGSGSWSGGGSSGYSRDQDVTNESQPTGRNVLGRLTAADPFLMKDQDYIFLARFDGVKEEPDESDEDHPKQVGIVTIISYFKPSPLMME